MSSISNGNNNSGRLAWLIAGIAVSILLNVGLGGALMRSGVDREAIQANSIKLSRVKEDVDRALPEIRAKLERIQKDLDRVLSQQDDH